MQVLDTGDHGNFNSWDRKPWVWLADPYNPRSEVRTIPGMHHIHNNFIIRTSFLGRSANLYCIDHDDGSSSYVVMKDKAVVFFGQAGTCLGFVGPTTRAPHVLRAHIGVHCTRGAPQQVEIELPAAHTVGYCPARGNARYNDTDNFLVYGGIKFREGVSKHASGNWMAYANGEDTYASRAVQFHPNVGQFDFARSSARTPHGAYV